MISAIGQLPFLDEETNTAHALTLARTGMFGANAPGDRPDVQNVAIVLTDGKPSNYSNTSGKQLAADAATMLRDSGVQIISIGVAQSISVDLLKDISSPPRVENQDYFPKPDFDEPTSLIQSIVDTTCANLPTPSETTSTVQATTGPIVETTTSKQATTTSVHDTTPMVVTTIPSQPTTTHILDTTTHILDTTTQAQVTTTTPPTIPDPSEWSFKISLTTSLF